MQSKPLLAALMIGFARALTPKRVVLVTGANKGIGKDIARQIGRLPDHTVVLGCRNVQLGQVAATELIECGCDAHVTRVDLTDPSSFDEAVALLEDRFGRLDALVNNAAVCFNDPTLYGRCAYTPFEQQARLTIQTNYFGTLGLTQACLPLLRASYSSPRVVNVASYAGRLRGSQAVVDAFTAKTLDVPGLSALMATFVDQAEQGVHALNGWPNTCYGVSKMGLIALTRILAKDEPTISINSVDPGYCATDQNDHQGVISTSEGAVTPSLLAHAAFSDGQVASGLHWYDGREMSWTYE